MENYDFSGYATKNDLKCKDGRTIRKDAFKENDGTKVPLVWQHGHKEPANVLGHALLENREDGVYTYAKFNSTASGQNAKQLVEHGDIKALSIYANDLVQKARDVIHGSIREVSLVFAGANPGAIIDNLTVVHSDGEDVEIDDEAIIYTGLDFKTGLLKHEESEESSEETVGDIFDTLSQKQKDVVYAMLADVITKDKEDDTEEGENEEPTKEKEEVTHSNDGGNNLMKKNVFDGSEEGVSTSNSLTHDQFAIIVADAHKTGSLKESFLAHAVEYGIENIDFLFPDAKTLRATPDFIKRETDWVVDVMSGSHHSPFSRIKSLAADITADEARAKGYVKGALKKEEVISLLRRVTTPTTIYKKQKLDRDDIVDITDMDVVSWLRSEMRVMLDEEIARAALLGDGRDAESDDKINETHIRPIYTDDNLYAHHVAINEDSDTEEIIDAIIRARINYKGSGNPALFVSNTFLTDMLLLKAADGRRLFPTTAELMAVLRVSKMVEVPQMEDLTRVVEGVTLKLLAIMVNMKDYTLGADKGGAVAMFDDFDIDYNQYKYLLETRCSGCLTKPKSALVIEIKVAAG